MTRNSLSTNAANPRDNDVLAALPPEIYARLLPNLQLQRLELGHALYESGDLQGYVFFPTTAIVSLLYVM